MNTTLTVRFFASVQGTEPVRDWLRTLSHEARKAIGEDIKTVQFGWPLGMPLVRKMVPGLWEIRSNTPAGIARLFFSLVGDQIVLLHGFVKKSARTPKDDLDLALRRMKELRNG